MDILYSISRIVALLIIVYALFVAAMYLFQDKLIFYPMEISEHRNEQIITMYSDIVEEVLFTASDSNQIHGWVVKDELSLMDNIVFYYGGNAEELSYLANHILYDERKFPEWTFVLINYRGYGLSQGKPGEAALISDALEFYEYFFNNISTHKPKTVVAMGRSIGTGVAVQLASEKAVDGVILVSPYDSFINVVRDIHPYLPVNLLLKHRFDSASKAKDIDTTATFFIATEDNIINPERSLALASAWLGEVNILELVGEDHNSFSLNPDYWNKLGDVLDGILHR